MAIPSIGHTTYNKGLNLIKLDSRRGLIKNHSVSDKAYALNPPCTRVMESMVVFPVFNQDPVLSLDCLFEEYIKGMGLPGV